MTGYQPEPHVDYMSAVADALTAAGLAPDSWHAEDNGGGRLDGVFKWNKSNPLTPLAEFPQGVVISWEQYNGWEYAPVNPDRFLGNFRELVGAMYADPSAVVTAARLLLAGNLDKLPVKNAPNWDGTDALYDAVIAYTDNLPE
jgi:hypothetical protein